MSGFWMCRGQLAGSRRPKMEVSREDGWLLFLGKDCSPSLKEIHVVVIWSLHISVGLAIYVGPTLSGSTGPCLNIKTIQSNLISIWANPMLKERWQVGHLFFNMVLAIAVTQLLYIEMRPKFLSLLITWNFLFYFTCFGWLSAAKMSWMDMSVVAVVRCVVEAKP